ncbi:MAG: hypothetical protein ACRECJ_02295 [Limisphaerales bacterium]
MRTKGGMMRKCFSVLTVLSSVFIFAASGYSQPWPTCLLQKIDGPAVSEGCYSVAAVGDLNGDGKDDFIAGFPFAESSGIIQVGYAAVYSGADGSVLFQTYGYSPDSSEYFLGASVAGLGDLNGDSVPDFIIGAPRADPNGLESAGSAFVYSGSDFSLLYQKDGSSNGDDFGSDVAGVGDLNGDSVPDFIISARSKDTLIGPQFLTGFVYVYSGADGSLLYQKFRGRGFGVSIAGAGDVNDDGTADFIVRSSFAGDSEFVFSGADSSLLFSKNHSGSMAVHFLASAFVDGAGDVNGDGKADVIVAAPAPASFNAAAYVYSGADSSLLFQKIGDSLGVSVEAVAGIGDVNGDGKSDFMLGGQPDLAFLFSGSDGGQLFKFSTGGLRRYPPAPEM